LRIGGAQARPGAGPRRRRGAGARPRAGARGFTLVELVIAIAVVAVLSAAAVPAMNAVTGVNARAAAGEIAGAMRFLFETASLRNQTCRLALDLDERAWWAECTRDRVFAARGAQDPRELAREDDEALEERFPEERDAEKRRLLAKAKWGRFEDRLARRRELPGGAAFAGVWAEHQREPLAKGRAYVYFYPQGRTELARVPVVDGDHAYTVTLQPYTGRAQVTAGLPEGARR
jgi:general secretion pathway protein H